MAKNPAKGTGKAVHAPVSPLHPEKPRMPGMRVVAAWLAVFAFVGYLVAIRLLLPEGLTALLQRALGLMTAGLAVGVYWLATHRTEHEDTLQRLRRGQHADFGKQLRAAKKKPRTLRLPLAGDVSFRAAGAAGLFALVAAWWLTPWAPVWVRQQKLEDLALPLGQEIEAVVLVLADPDVAAPCPPVPPQRARELARLIPDKAAPDQLGLKAVVEGRFEDARKLLAEALRSNPADKAKLAMVQGQAELYAGRFAEAAAAATREMRDAINRTLGV